MRESMPIPAYRLTWSHARYLIVIVGLRQIVRSFEASFSLITFGSVLPHQSFVTMDTNMLNQLQVLSLLVEAAIYIFFDVIVV